MSKVDLFAYPSIYLSTTYHPLSHILKKYIFIAYREGQR